jgi:Protein of unknown function (DUF1161)
MKHALLFVVFAFASAPVFAAKPCEELKAEIAKKIEAKGVKAYSIEIVANADVANQKVVGSCDGGTKKIVYVRK